MRAVIDTNVLLVANGQHVDVSEGLTIPSYERGVARLLRYDRHP